MSGYAQYLKDLLRPLRVYELEGTANGGELKGPGQGLGGVGTGPEGIQREVLLLSLLNIWSCRRKGWGWYWVAV